MKYLLLKSSEVAQWTHVPVVLPIGAVEQHGPHLPLGTDTLIVEGVLDRLEKTDLSAALVLPTIAVGHSPEHVGFPGTLSISEETLTNTIQGTAEWLEQSGFQRLVFVNAHGGNIAALASVVAAYRGNLKVEHYEIDPAPVEQRITELFGGSDWHAGDSESSMVAALLPDYEMPQVEGSVPSEGQEFPEEVRQLSANGILNHKPVVTVDPTKGAEVLTLMAEQLHAFLVKHK